MSAYVIDASVAVKVFLPEPFSAEARALANLALDPAHQLHAPDLFYAECANIFWKQVQRGNTTATQVEKDMNLLKTWILSNTSTRDLSDLALSIALNHNISAYDACYVALAHRLGVSLITADQKLQAKLVRSPYVVIWLGAWTPPP